MFNNILFMINMEKIGEHIIKTSSTSNVESIVGVSAKLHACAEIKFKNTLLLISEMVNPFTAYIKENKKSIHFYNYDYNI